MGILHGEHIHCRRCGSVLEGGEEVCPHCHYSPRESGFRLGALLMVAVVVFFSISVMAGNYYPHFAAYTMLAATVGFVFTAVVVVVAFAAKPYHFASLFR